MMTVRWSLALAFPFLLGCPVSSKELNRESFDELMASGRNGMIKFYQPWCGHCTRMKPDWDLLMEQAHSSVFIADVNCLVETDLCADHHTGGNYPTVLLFQQGKQPELYQGGRGVEDLLKFVDQNLVEKCDLSRLEETCSEKEQKYVAKWKEKGSKAWNKEVSRLLAMPIDNITYGLSKWVHDRIHILEQLLESAVDVSTKDEL